MSRNRRSLRLIATIFLVSVMIIASAGSKSFEPSASASFLIKQEKPDQQGAKLFAPNCGNAYCHGTGGMGGGAPRLRGRELDAAYLFKIISNGIPGTPMMSFKSEFSQEQIGQLVAFIMSDFKQGAEAKEAEPIASRPLKAEPKVQASSAESLVGNIQAGRALFFDSTQKNSCGGCHSFQGEGANIGPDLSKVADKSARELFMSIVMPRVSAGARYKTITITLRNGEKIVGIKKEEDDESIRVYDAAQLPAVLRTIQKPDVAGIETASESLMPKNYATIYTVKQLLDIVTFLKSSDPQSKSPITIKDLF